jgi:hypothetical protein
MTDYEMGSQRNVEMGRDTEGPAREDLLFSIKRGVLRLASMDDANFTDDFLDSSLAQSRRCLDQLKRDYPDDPDIYLFEEALLDLEGDLKEGVETELDESMDQMMVEMRDIFVESGVEQKDVNEVINEDSLVGETLRSMEELGVEAKYLVEAAESNAPVIILFMQHHPQSPGAENVKTDLSGHEEMQEALTLSEGVTVKPMEESQADIYEDAKVLIEDQIGSTLYAEFVPLAWGGLTQEMIDKTIDVSPQLEHLAALRLEEDLGERIDVMGYDVDPLKFALLAGKSNALYRYAGHNVYIASSLAEIHPGIESQPVSFATMGGGHEQYPNIEVDHHIPISHALAYYGFNVIVVDHAFS